ncbi:MAG TPA: tRNA (adenosine(37)-N6)-dimethylallyltransferase MiaA [Pseudogracilibacillus sp.]|nr:tRNA (adenosine(37)-N6)-dimethylallyltransferase MiaA [Pseudogracilibacillus sp.]
MEKVIIIVGPTAVGKTNLSIKLAKKLKAEVISGDSMQVYKGMNIGTGKVTEKEMEYVPHHMLDILNPDEPFSVADYQKQVQKKISDLNKQDITPLLVGGSGLYIQAVLYDYVFSDQKRDETLTKQLEARLETEGNLALYEELQQVDPVQAKHIHPNNKRRLIRALEVYQATGKTLSERQAEQNKTSTYDYYIIGLKMDREALYDQINQRVDTMVQNGLVEEVKHLYERGYEHTQAMKAIGYKELIPYIKGETDLNTAVELLKRNSRRYAKRQYTWFKNQMNIHWYDVTNAKYDKIVDSILKDMSET